MTFSETAYAKVNLALHVRARRDDCYHEIETLFAFVDDGDLLTVETANADTLTIVGEFNEGLSTGPDNLVHQALTLARALCSAVPPLNIILEKRLPVAAGLGGGSADAGALLRLIERVWPTGLNEAGLMAASSALGADVPACIASRTQFGSGVGDELQTTELDLKGQPILLLNPLVPCPTGPVFQGWDGVDRGALNPLEWRAGRNDLDNAATAICPEIGDVMTLLRAQLPVLARMSGSGATCFALFESDAAMKAAAGRIWDDHPDWWMLAGHMR